jgi:hypothetical protein
MNEFSSPAGAKRHRLRKLALGSTALSIMLMAGSAAMAAAPVANSLPGAFTTNTTGTTYTGASAGSTTATITIGTTTPVSGQVIQFGGTPLSATPISPVVVGTTTALTNATNPGFSVGAGATLKITGGAAGTDGAAGVPTLVNDQTGSASQIFGSVDASGLNGALFVSNANGVVVGAGGSFTAPDNDGDDGLGLLGYGVSSTTFGGSGVITVDSSTQNGGAVTVDPAASISGGELLVAGNGAVSVGAATEGVEVLAGYGFTTGADVSTTSVGSVLPGGSTAAVTFDGGTSTTPLDVTALAAGGNVTNSGDIDLPDYQVITGAFTNTGIAHTSGLTAGAIENAGVIDDSGGSFGIAFLTASITSGATSGADITNTGVINEAGVYLYLQAGAAPETNATSATGNFNNTGEINFTSGYSSGLRVEAANIYFGGSIDQASASGAQPTALSATNYLSLFDLYGGYGSSESASGVYTGYTGVVDLASTVYTNVADTYPDYEDLPTIYAGAVRILSGGIYNTAEEGAINFYLGAGTVTDPFFNNASLAYNLSLFPKTTVQADYIGVYGNEYGAPYGTVSTPSNSSNVNLDGVLSTQLPASSSYWNEIDLYDGINNINGSGGFALNDGGYLYADFIGNLNNPNGAAAAGSTAFQYNYVPVAVANTSSGATGTVGIELEGPSASSTTAQDVNLLVNGNVMLLDYDDADGAGYADGTPVLAPANDPSGALASITPAATTPTNNHLVVQASGNISLEADEDESDSGTFYWPGMVYLSTVASAANPTTQSATGSITLGYSYTETYDGDTYTETGATNLNNVLPANVSGGAGIFFETNNLDLDGSTVTTNTNSWVNFVSPEIASAYATTSAASFYDADLDNVTSTVTELDTQALPLTDFQ